MEQFPESSGQQLLRLRLVWRSVLNAVASSGMSPAEQRMRNQVECLVSDSAQEEHPGSQFSSAIRSKLCFRLELHQEAGTGGVCAIWMTAKI